MFQIPLSNKEFYIFLNSEKGKVLGYIRKTYSLSDEDCDDVFQNASISLYENIQNGKLTELTSSLSTYFLRICINQALKFLSKAKRSVPLIPESRLMNNNTFDEEKLSDLCDLCMSQEDDDYKSLSERIVDIILLELPDTCRNIFTSYYWQELSTTTIASMFGFANANSVKTQKYKCVDKFKKRYIELIKKEYE